MRKYYLISLCLIFILAVSGCGWIFTGYESKFSCPNYDKGQCISVQGAHKQSISTGNSAASVTDLEKPKAAFRDDAECDKCISNSQKKGLFAKDECAGCFVEVSSESKYERAVNEKLTAMLKKPTTPLMAPPKVMRVLFLPYQGDGNELYMTRYAYFMVDNPKWVIGKYLTEIPEE